MSTGAHGHTHRLDLIDATVREWDASGQRPSAPAIIRHFGAWNAALAAVGLRPTRHARRWSDQAHCKAGKVTRKFSKVKKGRVISQRPKPGTSLAAGAKVKLVISKGKKP